MSDNLDQTIGHVAESVGDIISSTTIPAPIKKNLFKAIGQLSTALLDIPLAHLEGVAAEKRAETFARIKSINETGNQIAKQIDIDKEYARIAQKKYADKIVREQVNLDEVSKYAIKEFDKKILEPKLTENNTEIGDIDLDWLNAFEVEASNKSSVEMQQLFGKILAGEVRQPSSFSIRTVKLISQIDSRTAQLFVRLCSLCFSMRFDGVLFDSRAITLGGQAGNNVLKAYDLGFDELNRLEEHGLILSNLETWRDYGHCVIKNNSVGFKIEFLKENWALQPDEEVNQNEDLKLTGVALTRSGMELLEIVDIEPNEEYNEALRKYLKTKKLSMVKV